MKNVLSMLAILAAGVLIAAGMKFFEYNAPIIKDLPLLEGLAGMALVGILLIGILCLMGQEDFLIRNRAAGVFLILSAVVLVFVFLESAVTDYFQPFSLYDDVIYMTLAGFLLLIVIFLMDGIRSLAGQETYLAFILTAALVLIFVGVFAAWGALQADFTFENIKGDPAHLFVGGSGGYQSYRIPGLVVIPARSVLADDSTVKEDIVMAFAEARVHGSLDDGDIDLVMRRSVDGGESWAGKEVVRAWEHGTGKIGNPTPVFDAETGVLHLLHIAGDKWPYSIWVVTSEDGGETFSSPTEVADGIVGPGHGIQVTEGPFAGRLLIPAHFEGSSTTLYSDDHGLSWTPGNPVGEGNESEVAMVPGGELLMVVRPNHSVAKPHDEMYQLFSTSEDWGVNWSTAEAHETMKTPICMSSLVVEGDRVFHSGPDDFYSRALMTISSGSSSELDFSVQTPVYGGPAGYSDLAVLSGGDLLLLFENGAVEYDERITVMRIDN